VADSDGVGGNGTGEQRPTGRDEPSDRGGVPHAIFAGLEGYERSVMALTDYRRSNADPAGSGWWSTEPNVGRVADGIPHRVDRLRSLGNAVVPQVVEFIGRRIVAFDERAEVAA
jgi:DNA (cytosine-5)-methyltransferase 1